MSTRIGAKRVYERSSRADGTRILVDRLWPRGVRREDASWQVWRKDVAPSETLRRWYGHDPVRFSDLARRYQDGARVLATVLRRVDAALVRTRT